MLTILLLSLPAVIILIVSSCFGNHFMHGTIDVQNEARLKSNNIIIMQILRIFRLCVQAGDAFNQRFSFFDTLLDLATF